MTETPAGDKVLNYRIVASPFKDSSGNIVAAIEIVEEITELKKLQENLKDSEEKYRKLFEGANDAIFITDPETGQILDANKQAEKLLEKPKGEICRMHQSQLHPPDEAELYKEMFKERVRVGGGADFEAEALALIDPYTQLCNYRYLQRRLRTEFEGAKRYLIPLSLLMIDIDYFKSINDTYGHEFGDSVLQEFAVLLRRNSREIDIVTRSGGKEFTFSELSANIVITE